MKIIQYFKKAGVFIVGLTVVIIGIALLVLPGPGLVVIAFGLLILSTEFDWAERHLNTIKAKMKQVIDKSKAARSKNTDKH